MNAKEPHVISFENATSSGAIGMLTTDTLQCINNNSMHVYQPNVARAAVPLDIDLELIKQYIDVCSQKIIERLYPFLRTRLLLSRNDLKPGIHWVWDSFRTKFLKVCAIMIMSKHIVPLEDFKYRYNRECLLSDTIQFREVCSLDDVDDAYMVL